MSTEDEAVVLPEASRLEALGVLGCLVGFEYFDDPLCEPYTAALAILRCSEGGTGLGLIASCSGVDPGSFAQSKATPTVSPYSCKGLLDKHP